MSATDRDTYSMAKALHHINIAKQYLEDVRIGSHGSVKAMFNSYINKCEWILQDIYDRLGPKTREIFKTEMVDSLGLEAINDLLMQIDNDQRAIIEDILENMSKDKVIKITIQKDE